MKLSKELSRRYQNDRLSAGEAQRAANEIAYAPVVFQISRLMKKFKIFDMIYESENGLSVQEIAQKSTLSKYGVKILLESSLSIGTVLLDKDKFRISKVGYFLMSDEMVGVNMDFIHDVCYEGLFSLEETIKSGKPKGLGVFGQWGTIYEALSHLPSHVRASWLAFDHYYSDHAFNEALEILFQTPIKTILDIGGNTGRFACECVAYNTKVEVSIMDLPGQIALMQNAVASKPGAERIKGIGANILDKNTKFPAGFDIIWLSQFLDCFSAEQITDILSRVASSMNKQSALYILEPFWNNQRYETAAYSMTQISVYFAAMANGNSKIYSLEEMSECVSRAGLVIEKCYDKLGIGHTLLKCTLS